MRGQVISYKSRCREVAGRSPVRCASPVSAAVALEAPPGVTLLGPSPQIAPFAAVLAVFAFIAEGRL